MESLSKSQYIFLKKLNKVKTIEYVSINESQKSICEYLESINLVSITYTSKYEENAETFFFYNVPCKISINENGIAYIEKYKTDKNRFLIPFIINTVLSIFAIIISIIALIG